MPSFSSYLFCSQEEEKSSSQLRRQERRRKEALAKAEEAATIVEGSGKDLSEEVASGIIIEADINKPSVQLVEKAAEDNCLNFKCDQCAYTNANEKGLW